MNVVSLGDWFQQSGDPGAGQLGKPVGNQVAVAVTSAYQEHGAAVYGLAARLCGPSAAEDVTQEVFLQVWRNPERYTPERGSLRTFLLTMAHHRAIDALRSTESRRRREDRSTHGSDDVLVGVEEQIADSDENEQIWLAVDTLPPQEREAIVTAFYGECTYREAAIILSVSEGTTKSRIRSALRRLAMALDERPRIGTSS